MSLWVRLCSVSEAPKPGEVTEIVVNGLEVCLANVDGELRALNNICPHRGGPLGQGWLEGTAVVCPWHSWAFDTRSGQALPPDCGKVDVISLRVDGDELLIEVS